MIKIHHLNCISTCPLGGRLMDGESESILSRGHLTCHCLLVETDRHLMLVDTGFGLRDVRNPQSRLSRFFLGLVSPEFREEMTAIRQIERLGFDPKDVRHILMTHLDFDHAGGLDDFPHASVHMLELERENAQAQKTWMDRQRFRPQQWNYQSKWHTYPIGGGESWYGFNRIQLLQNIPPEIAMIPLIGHTFGHAGVAIKEDQGWKLLAGDAYFYHAEMNYKKPYCTPGLEVYQAMLEKDRQARLNSQVQLRELARSQSGEVTVFCSHDVREFERLSGRSADIPAEKLTRFRAA
jgi:glyoxylase-like metal-dependent hydrolase (beta-lactamase superfamily II)